MQVLFRRRGCVGTSWPHLAVALVLSLTLLSGCANMQTVGRTTHLSGEKVIRDFDAEQNEIGSTLEASSGIAVHLDAQQRAIIQAGARYCAEPSPDAMAAYAASLGLGGSLSGSDAVTATSALSSAAANIGLRTQSIQLMRDALYRLCEAVNNDQITKSDMAMLLRRSQDLTAVVVAVEQLTGAVVAQQAILTSNSQATATASLVANQQILAQMEDQVADRQQAVDAAALAVSTATTERDQAADVKNQAESTLAQEDNETNKEATAEAGRNLNLMQATLDARQRELVVQEQRLEDAKRVRDQVKATRDASLAYASSSVNSTGEFGSVRQNGVLDDSAPAGIASAVDSMVTEVLNKDYTVDHCMILLASANDQNAVAVKICRDVMQVSATEVLGTHFGVDWASRTLKCLFEEGKVKEKDIKDWLKEHDTSGELDDIQLRLKREPEVVALRYQFIGDFMSNQKSGVDACGLK